MGHFIKKYTLTERRTVYFEYKKISTIFFPIHKRLLPFVSEKISKRRKSKYLPLSLCKNNLYTLETCCLLHFFARFGRMNLEIGKRERWLKKTKPIQTSSLRAFLATLFGNRCCPC